MTALKEWAISVCTVLVISSAISLVSPDDKTEKLMNTCISLFVLLVLMAPLAHLSGCAFPELNIESEVNESIETNNDSLTNCIEMQAAEQLSDTAEKLISARLAEIRIIPDEITVIMDTSDNGCISIGQIFITLDPSDHIRSDQACEIIRQMFGTEEVYTEGAQNEENLRVYQQSYQ